MTIAPREARLSIVIVGHVDHGKSTIVGRLLADTGSLPEGKLEQVRSYCEFNSKPFEDAFLLAALKDEQSQGITIDAARVFFQSARRPYLIIDAPGHIYEIRSGGIVRKGLPDRETWAREKVLRRNFEREQSTIAPERRGEQYKQKAILLLITGPKDADRKVLGKALEARLFNDGRFVYFLGIGNVLHGVDADVDRGRENRREHMRRLAEVANLMLDAGVMLIVTAAELTLEDLEIIRTSVEPDSIETIWVGDTVTTDRTADLHLPEAAQVEEAVDQIKRRLQVLDIIFRPQ